MDFHTFLTYFQKVSPSGKGWKGLCPAHPDRIPSLSIHQSGDGKILIHCFAGCSAEEIVGKVGLTMSDLMGPETPTKDQLRQVYLQFLQSFSLSPQDYDSLHARGLLLGDDGLYLYRTLENISEHNLKSLVSRFSLDFMLKVPGFIACPGAQDRVLPIFQSGIIFTVLDLERRIAALQIRCRNPRYGKYRWFAGGGSPRITAPIQVIRAVKPNQYPVLLNRTIQDQHTVIVTEGALKAHVIAALHDYQVSVLGLPGVNGIKELLPTLSGLYHGQENKNVRVVIAFDIDHKTNPAVSKARKRLISELHNTGYTVWAADWEPADGKGLDDVLNNKKTYRIHLLPRPAPADLIQEKTEMESPVYESRQPDLVTADMVNARPVRWMIRDWFAYGALHLLDGDPGLGKSLFSLYLSKRVSCDLQQNVLLLSAEDDTARTVVPRLQAAGANLKRVHILGGWKTENADLSDPVLLPNDFKDLHQLVQKHNIKLVVVDPLFAYLDGETNSYKDQDIRRVLGQFRKLAEKNQAVVLCIRHLNKSGHGPAIYRGGGSIGVIGAARIAMLAGRHPDGSEKLVIAQTKNNLAQIPPSRSYIKCRENDIIYLCLDEEELEITADDLLSVPSPAGDGPKLTEAVNLLNNLLADGPKPTTYIEAKAQARGIGESTLNKARKKLKVCASRLQTEPGKYQSVIYLPKEFSYVEGREEEQTEREPGGTEDR